MQMEGEVKRKGVRNIDLPAFVRTNAPYATSSKGVRDAKQILSAGGIGDPEIETEKENVERHAEVLCGATGGVRLHALRNRRGMLGVARSVRLVFGFAMVARRDGRICGSRLAHDGLPVVFAIPETEHEPPSAFARRNLALLFEPLPRAARARKRARTVLTAEKRIPPPETEGGIFFYGSSSILNFRS